MTLILVVEDDPAILQGLRDAFADEGYDVLTAPDGEVGDRLLRERVPDLVVLDLMLPKLSGHLRVRWKRVQAAGRARQPNNSTLPMTSGIRWCKTGT